MNTRVLHPISLIPRSTLDDLTLQVGASMGRPITVPQMKRLENLQVAYLVAPHTMCVGTHHYIYVEEKSHYERLD